MATSNSINYDDVCNAILSLESEQINPTLASIRTALGNRGSNSTIAKYFNVWKKRKTNKPSITPGGQLTQQSSRRAAHLSLSESISATVNKLCEQLKEESRLDNERIAKQADDLVHEALAEKKEVEQRHLESTKLYSELHDKFTKLKNENTKLLHSFATEQKTHAATKATLQMQEKIYEEMRESKDKVIDDQQRINKELNNRLKQVTTDHHQEISSVKKEHELKIEACAKEIENQKIAFLKLQQKNDTNITAINNLEQQNSTLEKAISLNKKEQQEIITKNDGLQKTIHEQRESLAEREATIKAYQEQVHMTKKDATDLQQLMLQKEQDFLVIRMGLEDRIKKLKQKSAAKSNRRNQSKPLE